MAKPDKGNCKISFFRSKIIIIKSKAKSVELKFWKQFPNRANQLQIGRLDWTKFQNLSVFHLAIHFFCFFLSIYLFMFLSLYSTFMFSSCYSFFLFLSLYSSCNVSFSPFIFFCFFLFIHIFLFLSLYSSFSVSFSLLYFFCFFLSIELFLCFSLYSSCSLSISRFNLFCFLLSHFTNLFLFSTFVFFIIVHNLTNRLSFFFVSLSISFDNSSFLPSLHLFLSKFFFV